MTPVAAHLLVGLLWLAAAAGGLPQGNTPPPPGVKPRQLTPEQLQSAVMSSLQRSRDLVDKLELHEKRERQLGEELKRSLDGIDKRQRATDLKVKEGMVVVGRLEAALRNMDERQAQRDEQAKEDSRHVRDLLATIHASLESCPPPDLSRLDATLSSHSASLERLEALAASPNDLSGPSPSDLASLSSTLSSLSSRLLRAASDAERLLALYDSRLAAFSLAAPPSNAVTLTDLRDWKPSLDAHDRTLRDLLEAVRTLPTLPDLSNATRDLFLQLQTHTDESLSRLESSLSSTLSRNLDESLRVSSEAASATDALYSSVARSYDLLLGELRSLSQMDKVLIQTADNVMDTRRRVEYGVHQVLLEVGDLVKQQGSSLNATFDARFDLISRSILESQSGSLANLSLKIETEISQVWRQIGIMYQQLTASAAVLDHLQNQTDAYVNGSLRTMDRMTGNVGLITDRMSEVDDNLNYLLGRLSLVAHEFNDIKSGLASALDSVRDSFLEVNRQILDVGPPGGEPAPPLGLNVPAQ